MAKKILIITGSPRKNGNSARMAQAFAKGAEQNGHQITWFHAAGQAVAGCTACDRCWTAHRACVIDDRWQEFAHLLENADVVVFAYPLYWSSMPAQLKAVVDRLYSYCSDKAERSLSGKETVLLLCGECKGQEIFKEALSMHQGLNGYFDWKNAGTLTIDGVFESGAVEKTDGLLRAEALGRSI